MPKIALGRAATALGTGIGSSAQLLYERARKKTEEERAARQLELQEGTYDLAQSRQAFEQDPARTQEQLAVRGYTPITPEVPAEPGAPTFDLPTTGAWQNPDPRQNIKYLRERDEVEDRQRRERGLEMNEYQQANVEADRKAAVARQIYETSLARMKSGKGYDHNWMRQNFPNVPYGDVRSAWDRAYSDLDKEDRFGGAGAQPQQKVLPAADYDRLLKEYLREPNATQAEFTARYRRGG